MYRLAEEADIFAIINICQILKVPSINDVADIKHDSTPRANVIIIMSIASLFLYMSADQVWVSQSRAPRTFRAPGCFSEPYGFHIHTFMHACTLDFAT